MVKIATHNSATGEKGKGILSFLVMPFSRCQSKTIKEQYKAGCRYFDIRVRKNKRGWICAHGLWTTKRLLQDILSLLDNYGDCYVMLTYEGKKGGEFILEFNSNWKFEYKKIKFTSINIKLPEWKNVQNINSVYSKNYYKCLDGSSWHTYLPIPWLWKKIYYNKPVFNTEYFTTVDFL